MKSKLRGYRTLVEALTLGAVLPIVGCQTGDEAVDPELAPSLVALLEDGPLPATMAGGEKREPPPRFCDNGGFPFPGSNGGVPGSTGGFPFPGDDGGGMPDFGSSGGSGGGSGGFDSGGSGFDTNSTGGFGSGGGSGFGSSGSNGFDDNSTGGLGSGGSSGFGSSGSNGFDDNSTGGLGSGGSSGFGSSGSNGFDDNSTGGFGTTGGFGSGGFSSGGFGSGGFGSGGGFEQPTCEDDPIGFWRFDDCNDFRSNLQDSSNEGHFAFRAVDVECVPGKEGLAVSIAKPEDLVYAPDQPGFVLDEGVTVAAWVKPTKLEGVSTIFRKRDDTNSAFALVINGKRFQFVVKLASGKVATVSAPAKANVFTHVAASYDGTYLRLYKDGSEVAKTKAVGTLSRGAGPLLMGNDLSKRRLSGLIDNAWFNTLAAPEATIAELTCVHAPPTLAITPEVGPAVQGGTAVPFSLSVTNNNTPNCAPEAFFGIVSLPSGFNASSTFLQTLAIPSGATDNVAFDVASSEETEPGSYPFNVDSFSFPFGGSGVRAQATYVVAETTGCHVSSGRELLIRDVSVVEDVARTTLNGPSSDPRTGAFTFARLMERLAPSPAAAADATEAMFRSFLTPQTVNGFTISTRPSMDPAILRPWPRTADGKLDLARAPVRLLAIVNRLDLKDLSKGKAGEGRFVFGVLDPFGNPLEFTVIFEYAMVANSEAEARAWADEVHALASLPFPSEAYNAALQAITDKFSGRGALPGAPNGSALIDIRTNEIALGPTWELREFRLSSTGLLEPATLGQTPDASLNGSFALGRFINDNESIILTERHEVPTLFEDAPFAAASVFNNIDTWDAPGVFNPEARHKFSLNTCNGCHGGETQTSFLHINPRFSGQASTLSGFMTGINVFDRTTGQQRRLAELSRRRQLLESIVCEEATP